jgi:hypothetical protein
MPACAGPADHLPSCVDPIGECHALLIDPLATFSAEATQRYLGVTPRNGQNCTLRIANSITFRFLVQIV